MVGVSALAVVAAYFVVALMATPRLARSIAEGRPHCHEETRIGQAYQWHTQDRCLYWCREGCWRADYTGSHAEVLTGLAASLVWPLALAYLAIHRAAQPRPLTPLDSDVIAQMEKELGL